MSSSGIFAPLTTFLVLFLQASAVDSTDLCNPDDCKLPDCFCSGTKIPGNLSLSSTPQIVMISFDAAVVDNAFPLYEELFDGTLKNPNGCNISATFFVSHEFTNYCMLQTLYHQRHEIADNSISRRLPQSWWATATKEEQMQEIGGMREILRKWGNVQVKEIKGYRAPYVQVGGNTEFGVLRDLGFLYESSMPTQHFIEPPLWPYTLDYLSTQDCVIQPCPTSSFPGLWEVPLVDYIDQEGILCNFVESCTPPNTVEEAYELFNSNFERHYTTNRAPFYMLLEEQWLANSTYYKGTVSFLRKLASMSDVWIVTVSQALEWIQSPTSLRNIEDFAPWKCDSQPPADCPPGSCKTCYYPQAKGSHVMKTCAPSCPPNYPWVGNPDGN